MPVEEWQGAGKHGDNEEGCADGSPCGYRNEEQYHRAAEMDKTPFITAAEKSYEELEFKILWDKIWSEIGKK
jgi:hypothetical protein